MVNRDQINRTGIVIAGGDSKRMGTDKGSLLFKGKTFIEHSIDALQPFVQRVMIISSKDYYDHLVYERKEDLIPNAGPLAGLYTGLYHSKTADNLVVSCDVPLVTEKIFQLLLDEENDPYDIVQCKNQDGIMPLVGRYKKQCAIQCKELLDAGEKRLMELSKHLNTKTILLSESQGTQIKNINTKEELKIINNEGYD